MVVHAAFTRVIIRGRASESGVLFRACSGVFGVSENVAETEKEAAVVAVEEKWLKSISVVNLKPGQKQ